MKDGSKVCKGCGGVFPPEELQKISRRKKTTKTEPWCIPCARKRDAAAIKNARAKSRRKNLLSRNSELRKEGKQICSVCLRIKLFSEFRTSQPHRKGKLSKMCDACLTRAATYKCNSDFSSPEYWRRRAYSCNNAALARIRRNDGGKPTLKDLDYECKPQDLVELYNRQDGKCIYCGVTLEPEGSWKDLRYNAMTVDHMHSLAKQGKHCFENLVLACSACNYLKGAQHGNDFHGFLLEYAKRVLKNSGIKG